MENIEGSVLADLFIPYVLYTIVIVSWYYQSYVAICI